MNGRFMVAAASWWCESLAADSGLGGTAPDEFVGSGGGCCCCSPCDEKSMRVWSRSRTSRGFPSRGGFMMCTSVFSVKSRKLASLAACCIHSSDPAVKSSSKSSMTSGRSSRSPGSTKIFSSGVPMRMQLCETIRSTAAGCRPLIWSSLNGSSSLTPLVPPIRAASPTSFWRLGRIRVCCWIISFTCKMDVDGGSPSSTIRSLLCFTVSVTVVKSCACAIRSSFDDDGAGSSTDTDVMGASVRLAASMATESIQPPSGAPRRRKVGVLIKSWPVRASSL